jgi:alginate O-acetyltransferase complex protein AlgI
MLLDIEYLFFLFFIIAVNYFLPVSQGFYLLLVAGMLSLVFYHPVSMLVLLLLALVNYFLAKQLSVTGKRKHLLAGIGINAVFILLFNFYSGHQFILKQIGFEPSVYIIAAGLSFYSIQHMIYLADIASGKIKWEEDFLRHLLAISFLPKLISGPVVPIQDFTKQIGNRISNEHITQGLHRFFLGLLKKMLIADRLAGSVHSVFDFHTDYPGITYFSAALLFTFQLYFDFSGYSDMAIGMARMLGFTLPENFDKPFRALSVSAFWRRWHMSLIGVFTNYIYFPLVYRWRKLKPFSVYIGIVATFLISGLWHGLSFTFLCWALCHCVYLCVEHASNQYRQQLMEPWPPFVKKFLGLGLTLTAVTVSNVFFRVSTIGDALHIFGTMGSKFLPQNWSGEVFAPLAVGGQQAEYFNFSFTLLLVFVYLIFEKKIEKHFHSARWSYGYTFIALLLLLLFGVFNSGERFIYMQF